MRWIIGRRDISDSVTILEIEANDMALAIRPGQHINVVIGKGDEPLPMVIAKVNICKGTITLFVQKIDSEHFRLASLNIGDEIYALEGPLGNSIPIKNLGKIICVAGGIGINPLFPIVEALKLAGNEVITILGAKSADYLILQDEFKQISDELILYTDDGSCGEKGLVTKKVSELLQNSKVNLVIAMGSFSMIKNTILHTHRNSIPIIANLYTIRVNGEGLNEIYSISVCEHSKLICVDGINFNAYFKDFDSLIERMEKRLKSEFQGSQDYQLIAEY